MAEVETRLLIGGEAVAGEGEELAVENPATEETVADLGSASPEQVSAAVAGREGLEAFQETKHVHIETEIAAKEWWYPYSEYSRTRDASPHDGAGA